jgi:hypothetical protein
MRALLPNAPNPNGWPYRLAVSWEEKVSDYTQQGLVTHAISVMPPGRHHFRLEQFGADRAMVWLPFKEGQSLASVVDDELRFVERFVDALPQDAGLLVFSKILAAPALALVQGLLARQVGWERAGELTEDLRATLSVPVAPTHALIDAWRKRLSAREEIAS